MPIISTLISPEALRLNPLVTGWDDTWRPIRLELEDGTVLSGDPDRVRADAAALDPDRSASALAALDAFAVHRFTLPCPAHPPSPQAPMPPSAHAPMRPCTPPITCGDRTLIMGIINVTPDSFSDGGAHLDPAAAIERGLRLAEQGAHILDIGGESTRPGAAPVPADEERRRTVPVIAELARQCRLPLSIDTSKASVAVAALDAGASIVNDVTALRDPDMAPAVARAGAALILMHMQGEPRTMQQSPRYTSVLREIAAFLRRAMANAAAAGVPLDRIVIDPGIGFGKTLAHNLEIIRRLPVLASLGRPILIGVSRKSLMQAALGLPPERRLFAGLALNLLSIAGRASIIRVHDVREAAEAAAMADAVRAGKPAPFGKA